MTTWTELRLRLDDLSAKRAFPFLRVVRSRYTIVARDSLTLVIRFQWPIAVGCHLNTHLMPDAAIREHQPAKPDFEAVLVTRLHDKQTLYVGVARIQQATPFVQKANLQLVDSPWEMTSIGHNAGQPEVGLGRITGQRRVQQDQIIPVTSKTAPAHAPFSWGNPADYHNCHYYQRQTRHAHQQFLSQPHMPSLL
jgi:hypothetical protein